MKTYIMLVGLPGSGKSTWTKNFLEGIPYSYSVLSSDHFIEMEAARLSTTYTDIFGEYVGTAMKLLREKTAAAFSDGVEVVVQDQTNMNEKTRAKKLAEVPIGYRRIAVYFEVEENELKRRLAARPDKFIPDHVIKSMKDSYERPKHNEKFHFVFNGEKEPMKNILRTVG